jgi:hypothetical protein
MAAAKKAVLPPASIPWINTKDGTPTDAFRNFMTALGSLNIGPLTKAANDGAAAQAGVPVNGLYHADGVVRVRLA